MKRLIVNADDYGLTPGVSAGIRQAHHQGLVTSTTVMVNMPGAAAEVERALADCPRLGLGVHLVLTAGRPMLPPDAIGSVVALADDQGFPKVPQLAAGLNQVVPEQVEAEWRAQVERFVSLTGARPTHLDSHHHSSYFSPELFAAMLRLARDVGCAIRAPLPVASALAQVPDGALRMPGSSALIERALVFLRPMLAAAPDVARPDHFEPRFSAAQANPGTLHSLLAGLPDGTTELMCHPGQADAALEALSSYSRYRPLELAALTDSAVLGWVHSQAIELIHFGQLQANRARPEGAASLPLV